MSKGNSRHLRGEFSERDGDGVDIIGQPVQAGIGHQLAEEEGEGIGRYSRNAAGSPEAHMPHTRLHHHKLLAGRRLGRGVGGGLGGGGGGGIELGRKVGGIVGEGGVAGDGVGDLGGQAGWGGGLRGQRGGLVGLGEQVGGRCGWGGGASRGWDVYRPAHRCHV